MISHAGSISTPAHLTSTAAMHSTVMSWTALSQRFPVTSQVRITACDYPSKFSRHYSGNMPGPVLPFGFEIGFYAYESEHAAFTSPELCTARTQILDYFAQQKAFLTEQTTIFRFERHMSFTAGDINMMNQICLSMGFAWNT